MNSKKFDNIIAMNLITLAVLTSAYGISVCAQIPEMERALSQSSKLVPMPEVIDFTDVRFAKGGK